MAVSNRAAKLTKLLRVCKKHYQPIKPPTDRSVLEHLMYACCLEDSEFEAADEALARLQESYFDWNEIRVTTAVELAEVLNCVRNASGAANRLKKTLHSVFETHYDFNIDHLRKENLGKAIQQLQKYKGISPFVVSYVAQNALSGHSIAVDKSLLRLMYTVGIIEEKEVKTGTVPGMERAIPKNKGVEFFSLVHQLAVAFHSSPFNNDLRKILLDVSADASERFPKRKRKTAAKKTAKKPAKAAAGKSTATKKKAAKKKVTTKKAAAKTKAAAKKATPKKKTAVSKTKKKSPTKRLAKKKPR